MEPDAFSNCFALFRELGKYTDGIAYAYDWIRNFSQRHPYHLVPDGLEMALENLFGTAYSSLAIQIWNRHERFLRLVKGNRTALSMRGAVLVNYLRAIGVSEGEILAELQHPSWTKPPSIVDEYLRISDIANRLTESREGIEEQVRTQLLRAKAMLTQLAEGEQRPLQERIASIERTLVQVRDQRRLRNARVEVNEAECLAGAAVEIHELITGMSLLSENSNNVPTQRIDA
jgi:hypothetical protein